MVYRIEFAPVAKKTLLSLRRPAIERLDERISALALDPRPPGSWALLGQWKGTYRIRSGVFRIIYQIQDDRLIVTVIRVGDRRDVYER